MFCPILSLVFTMQIKIEKNFAATVIFLLFTVHHAVNSAAVLGQWNAMEQAHNSSRTGSIKKMLRRSSSTRMPYVAPTSGPRTTSIIKVLDSSGSSWTAISPKEESDEIKLEIKLKNKKRPSSHQIMNKGDFSTPNTVNNKNKISKNNKNQVSDKRKVEALKKKQPNNNVSKQPKKDVKQKIVKPGDDESESEQTDLLTDLAQGYKTVYSKVQHWWKDLESSFSLTSTIKSEGNKKVKKETQLPPKESKAKPPKKKDPPPKQKQTKPWFDLEKIVMFLGSVVMVLDIFGIR